MFYGVATQADRGGKDVHDSGFTSKYHSTQTRIAKQFLGVARSSAKSTKHQWPSQRTWWQGDLRPSQWVRVRIRFSDNNLDQAATSLVIIRQVHSDGKDPRSSRLGQGLDQCVARHNHTCNLAEAKTKGECFNAGTALEQSRWPSIVTALFHAAL